MNIAEIAQTVERCVEGAGVLGSIPSLGTTIPDGAMGRRAWLKPKLLRVRSPLGIPTHALSWCNWQTPQAQTLGLASSNLALSTI